MVKINKNSREIIIKVDGDSGELVLMQNALIDMMQSYNFKDFGNGADTTFFYALKLLQASLPDFDQQQKGFINELDYMCIPEGITEKQKDQLRSAMLEISSPGALKNPQKNPITEALRSIDK